MSKVNWKSLLISPVILAATLFVSSQAMAVESQNSASTNQSQAQLLAQATDVDQFSDVPAGHWAREALQNLVNNYNCVAGYPDGTFRGNQAITRYEFAAALSGCLQEIEAQIGSGSEVSQQDLVAIQRLLGEFEAELVTLSTRVDKLEESVTALENQSTPGATVNGEAIISGTVNFSDDAVDDQFAAGTRVRLDVNATSNGSDNLLVRLESGNLEASNVGDSGEATQTFNVGENDNNIELDKITYQRQVGNRVNGYVAVAGGEHHDYAETLNPNFDDKDGGNGALSTFATQNPIYRVGGGTGAAATVDLGAASVTAGYLASNADSAEDGQGLFNGDNAILGQANLDISDSLSVGATYVRGNHSGDSPIFGSGTDTARVGTEAANFASGLDTSEGKTTNSYGANVAWTPSDNVSLSGYFNYTDINATGNDGDGEVLSGGVGATLGVGNNGTLGVFGGVQPFLDSDDADVPVHVEAFYKYDVNENISITPGVIYQTNVNQNEGNGDNVIGTLRTTFKF